ncbi:MAG: hypothetical protein RL272_292 [Candidatus Parcubacteria bacterium]|jgi:hypothetical protein
MNFQHILYLILSWSTAAVAVASVFVAREAIDQGLAYKTQRATIVALTFFAIGRIWKTIREMTGLNGSGAEFIEYALYFTGYSLFIFLTLHVRTLRPIMKREAAPAGQKNGSALKS